MSKSSSKGDGMKQKSLMSFFGKSDATSKSTKTATPKSKTGVKAGASTKKQTAAETLDEPSSLRTPAGKGASQSSGISSAKYSRSSDGGSSAFETPPTSDPIDVDMSSELDDESTTEPVSLRPFYCSDNSS